MTALSARHDRKYDRKTVFTNHLHFFSSISCNFNRLFVLFGCIYATAGVGWFFFSSSSSFYVYIDVCLWAWTAWANVKSFSDYKSSNLKYVPFAHARFYLRVFIFCTSTLFIVNSIVFSNFIMKYDIEVKTRRKKLFNENNCNDFFCSFQTYSNKHRKKTTIHAAIDRQTGGRVY